VAIALGLIIGIMLGQTLLPPPSSAVVLPLAHKDARQRRREFLFVLLGALGLAALTGTYRAVRFALERWGLSRMSDPAPTVGRMA
jgi:CBS-domain-containing membrane protein